MNILCKLKLHRWQYRSWYDFMFPDLEHITRYCERCEKIEKTLSFLPASPLFPPTWELVIPKKRKIKE